MDPKFGGVIWTNHALGRLKSRGIKQGDAWATWRNPDQSRYATNKGAWVYYKTCNNSKIEVVAKQNASGPGGKKQWLVLSVWSKPAGERFVDEKPEPLLDLIFKRIFKKGR
jgi:hypothetical protein